MREALDEEQAFAVWNTVTDRFLTGIDGNMMWSDKADFISSFPHDCGHFKRILLLLPEWAIGRETKKDIRC